jgi:hypothetical protein
LFLAGCLSNHPDIHCPREEPFRRESIWQQKLGLGHEALLDFVLSEPFYPVSMCRLTYDQAFHPEIEGYLKSHQVRIIHLVRGVMATVTSTLLAKQEMERGAPRHCFGDDVFVDDEVLNVGPEEVGKRIKHLLRQRRLFGERFGDVKQLLIHYEDMFVSLPAKADQESVLDSVSGVRICSFLGVSSLVLATGQRKMHNRQVESYYKRWKEIDAMLKNSLLDICQEVVS